MPNLVSLYPLNFRRNILMSNFVSQDSHIYILAKAKWFEAQKKWQMKVEKYSWIGFKKKQCNQMSWLVTNCCRWPKERRSWWIWIPRTGHCWKLDFVCLNLNTSFQAYKNYLEIRKWGQNLASSQSTNNETACPTRLLGFFYTCLSCKYDGRPPAFLIHSSPTKKGIQAWAGILFIHYTQARILYQTLLKGKNTEFYQTGCFFGKSYCKFCPYFCF